MKILFIPLLFYSHEYLGISLNLILSVKYRIQSISEYGWCYLGIRKLFRPGKLFPEPSDLSPLPCCHLDPGHYYLSSEFSYTPHWFHCFWTLLTPSETQSLICCLSLPHDSLAHIPQSLVNLSSYLRGHPVYKGVPSTTLAIFLPY